MDPDPDGPLDPDEIEAAPPPLPGAAELLPCTEEELAWPPPDPPEPELLDCEAGPGPATERELPDFGEGTAIHAISATNTAPPRIADARAPSDAFRNQILT